MIGCWKLADMMVEAEYGQGELMGSNHYPQISYILIAVISCLSRQYSGLYLSSTLPTLLPASNIPDRCTIGGLLHDYRNPPPTDYFRIFPTIRSILQP